ncbi:MAG: hypothetical protein DME76_10625 [Verrucomicrobia bacterium]|nr:MAG: hypothetical protein DME76_10625 [Verrucomicrobiota bacterium]
MGLSILLATPVYAANSFLDARDDKPTSARFRGTEWGDEIPQDEIPLTAQVVTTRIANMPWGAIFKIEFVNVKSRAPQPRKIQPKYFVVTDDLIALVNEEDIPAAIKRNSTRAKFMASRAAASITKTDHGKRQSDSKATSAFTMRAIPPVISKKLSGRKESD